jgi:capsular polysaccharide biosynthesis protein
MNARFFCGLAALIIGLLLGARGIDLLFSPIKYKATVLIKIEPDVVTDDSGSHSSVVPYDPYFMETELKIIESEKVLSNVVQALNLDEAWGKHYSHGTLSMNEAIQLLRWRMEIMTPQDTRLVQISVWDEDPAQAAQMANSIVRAYRDYREQQHKEEMAAGLEVTKKHYQSEEIQITNMESQLEQWRKRLNLTNADPSDDVLASSYHSYYQFECTLREKKDLHKLLGQKIIMDENDAVVPQPLVMLINPADAAEVVRSQNRQLGTTFLIGGLALSGFGFYWLRPPKRAAGAGLAEEKRSSAV